MLSDIIQPIQDAIDIIQLIQDAIDIIQLIQDAIEYNPTNSNAIKIMVFKLYNNVIII